jgi:uncharacterized metal-binding protein
LAKKMSPRCSQCPTKTCTPSMGSEEKPDLNKAPDFCPMTEMKDVLSQALSEYQKPEVKEFARQASIQEFECYEMTPEGRRTKNPRIVELIQFSKKMGYKRLGLAFCGGLSYEAKLLTDMLENQGFEVISARCKMGGVPKETIGIKPEQKIGGPTAHEPMCNPIGQAQVMNSEKVDFAVMLGLCLGHDTLFLQYCKRPVTVLAVKDRVTGHNPLAPLYTSGSYYSRLMPKKK